MGFWTSFVGVLSEVKDVSSFGFGLEYLSKDKNEGNKKNKKVTKLSEKEKRELKVLQVQWCDLFGDGLLLFELGNEQETESCSTSLGCKSVERLLFVLSVYGSNYLSFEESNVGEVVSFFEAFENSFIDYGLTELLDDFNHCLYFHVKQAVFWNHSVKASDCKLNNCVCLQRRQGQQKTNKDPQNLVKMETQFAILDVVDKIHSFISHRFGQPNDFEDICGDEQQEEKNKVHDNDEKKQQMLRPYKQERKGNKINKFCTQIEQENNDEKSNTAKMPSFGFGYMFYYWNYFNDWGQYIGVGYHKNFKEECINNKLAPLKLGLWKIMLTKATKIKWTRTGKQLKAQDYGQDNKDYEILVSQPISISHICSLLLYTNHTKIQNIYKKECCRLKKEDGGDWTKLMERHKHILQWNKLFRETVMFYGRQARPKDLLFHGLSF